MAWISPRRTIHFIFGEPFHLSTPAVLSFCPSSARARALIAAKLSSPQFVHVSAGPVRLSHLTHKRAHAQARQCTCAHGESSPCLFPAVSLNVETFGLKAAVIFASDSAAVPPGEHKCQDPTDSLAEVHRCMNRQSHEHTSSEGFFIQRTPQKFFCQCML